MLYLLNIFISRYTNSWNLNIRHKNIHIHHNPQQSFRIILLWYSSWLYNNFDNIPIFQKKIFTKLLPNINLYLNNFNFIKY